MKTVDDSRLAILIVRLSAIGDIVFSTPLIHALRQRYPNAHISWLVQPESASLLEKNGELDEVILWPRAEWSALWRQRRYLALWRRIREFRSLLCSRRFDMALDIQSLLKSGFFAWLSGARQKIGLGSREGSQWLMNRVIAKGGDPRRIGSEYLHFAQQLGLPSEGFEMQIGLAEEDIRYAEDTLSARGLEQGFVAICPFTTRPQKHWFNRSWQALIRQMGSQWGKPVVILGGPGDRTAVEALSAEPGVVDLVGATTLRQAAAVIGRADLVIGVDTGLTHMGIAMRRPTLCLFGSTCPYLDTAHDNAKVIYHAMECSPCRRRPTCNGRFDCMASITPEEVMAEAEKLPKAREAEA